jgi:arylformamidase
LHELQLASLAAAAALRQSRGLMQRAEKPMTAIDYEKEYDNRARVPEHPQIFSTWARDAAAYREQALAQKRAELGLRYGRGARQTIDLFFAHPGAIDAPLALFVHGGWWRSLAPASFSHLAAGLNGHGVNVAVAGYDLCPQVTIAAIIEEIRQACLFLWTRFRRRLLIYGHSAGGHLTGAMLATDWTMQSGDVPAQLVPAGLSISGVFDLLPLINVSMNQDFHLDAEQARRLSPALWPAPTGLTLDALVGALESSEFLRQSRLITDLWGKAGVTTRYEEVAGTNHFTVLAPLSDPTSSMVRRLVWLAERASQRSEAIKSRLPD